MPVQDDDGHTDTDRHADAGHGDRRTPRPGRDQQEGKRHGENRSGVPARKRVAAHRPVSDNRFMTRMSKQVL